MVVGAVLALGGGCGRTTTVQMGDAEVKTTVGDDGSFTMKSDDGSLEITGGVGAKVPADWPKDVPLDESEIVGSLKTPEGFMLTLKSDESADELVEEYRTGMSGEGWSETAYSSYGPLTSVVWDKDKRTAALSVQTEEGKKETQVVLTITNNQE